MTMMQIKYFVTVAKCASFTKAAEQLYVSQPALSRHIKNMEEEMNIQLFVRTNTGIRLTPAGSVLYVGFKDMYDNYNNLLQSANKVQQGLNGSLKIGVLDEENVADFMPQIYGYFKEQHPNVDLTFATGSFETLLSGIYSGKFDMIFSLQFEIENKESVIYQRAVKSKDYIVMSKHHPLAKKEVVTLEDVKEEKFVLISKEDNPESSDLIHAICKKHGFVPNACYAKTLAEQILWTTVGMGITILDSRTNLKNNPDVKFYEIESDWDPSLVVAWHQNNYNPLIAVFIKKMNEVLEIEGEDLYGFE